MGRVGKGRAREGGWEGEEAGPLVDRGGPSRSPSHQRSRRDLRLPRPRSPVPPLSPGALRAWSPGELTQYLPFGLAGDVLEQTRTVQRRLRVLPSRAGVYCVLALGRPTRAGGLPARNADPPASGPGASSPDRARRA